nr:RusA family crossover junction endodeoxyribonuclease [Acetobacter persici]
MYRWPRPYYTFRHGNSCPYLPCLPHHHPRPAQGQGSPAFGNGRTFTDAKTVQAEKHIQRHAMEQIGKPCLTGPLHLSLTISIAPPPSWSRKKTADALAGRILPTSRPDIDNQMKTAADALNGIAWKDDAQIVDAWLSRRYGPESATIIEVRPL